MTLNAATVAPYAAAPIESEVSLTRLYILRAMYLLLIVGGGIAFLPQLIVHEPTARGVIPSMLGGVWLLACFGLRYPLQMLPVLLFAPGPPRRPRPWGSLPPRRGARQPLSWRGPSRPAQRARP